ncbi:MAG: TolC family protein [Rubripirellula sp.]|nr:TolC family protein [Rubripirellula sp.]
MNADREVYHTIAERNHDPRWAVPKIGIEMDRRSRYFDPYNPDCSPMPMDDPASSRYMRRVDGKKGWKYWWDNGIRSSLENPVWQASLGDFAELTDEGAVRLDADSALQLAYVNSPQNQRALETLYLSSLDVTGERFRLDTQFFGGHSDTYDHRGNVIPATIAYVPAAGKYLVTEPLNGLESNRLDLTSDLVARKRFATAGDLLVGFANSFVFEFTGGDASLSSSLANFSFIQPLLRGAGRDIALEQLTLGERRLLGNLRAYSQFRQGFLTQIVIGELGVTGPQRFGASTVLQSFSGIGGVGGYLGLLQQAQQIRNTEGNLRLQLRTRDRLEALYDNELIDIVQVDQFRQNIELTRANLLDQKNLLQLAVDNYKTKTLGLPPDLPVDIDETLVEGFQLIPTGANPVLESLLELQSRIGAIGELTDLNIRIETLVEQVATLADQNVDRTDAVLIELQGIVEAVARRLGSVPKEQRIILSQANDAADELEPADQAARERIVSLIEAGGEQLRQTFDDAAVKLEIMSQNLSEESLDTTTQENSAWLLETLELCQAIVVIQSEAINISSEPELVLLDVEQLVEPVGALFAVARIDVDRMQEVVTQRERFMRDDEKIRFKRDRDRLRERLNELETGEVGFGFAIEQLNQIKQDSVTQTEAKTTKRLTAWIQAYMQLVERLSLIPAQARLEVITVEKVDLEPDQAFQIALQNRLDFMNGRAVLVDRWREIQVAADALQSNLTITGSGDVRTAKNNPVDFRAATSSIRLGLEFDAPLARLLERNGYRATLIEFQRSRRNLIQSEDELQKGLRALLRTLEQRRLQLDIQRRAVSIALRRVDQTQLSLVTPPPQSQPGIRPQISPTTAINLLSAQSSLQTSQNSFLAAWLRYYASRLRLYRELGIMQLDSSGRLIESSVESFSTPQAMELEVIETLEPPIADGLLESLPPPEGAVGETIEGDKSDAVDSVTGSESPIEADISLAAPADVGETNLNRAENRNIEETPIESGGGVEISTILEPASEAEAVSGAISTATSLPDAAPEPPQ